MIKGKSFLPEPEVMSRHVGSQLKSSTKADTFDRRGMHISGMTEDIRSELTARRALQVTLDKQLKKGDTNNRA